MVLDCRDIVKGIYENYYRKLLFKREVEKFELLSIELQEAVEKYVNSDIDSLEGITREHLRFIDKESLITICNIIDEKNKVVRFDRWRNTSSKIMINNILKNCSQ